MNSDAILDRVLAGERDEGVVSAALDAFREDGRGDLLAAVRWIAAELLAAEEAAELATAAALLSENSPHRVAVRQMIAAGCPEGINGGMTAIVIPGERAPRRAATHGGRLDGVFWSGCTVTVGARWVLTRWAEVLNTVGRSGGPALYSPDRAATG